jgi:hypothetical protein
MEEFDEPAYALALDDSQTRAAIESAKPGKEIAVRVRPENDASAASVVATGKLSEDGRTFHVRVVTAAGQQSHEWTWSCLQEKLRVYRDR